MVFKQLALFWSPKNHFCQIPVEFLLIFMLFKETIGKDRWKHQSDECSWLHVIQHSEARSFFK